jgi:hypothetical protein
LRICWKRRLYLRGCICSVNKIHEFLFIWIASVWKYRTRDVCCVIVVLLCLSVFESLRVREIRKAWTSFGDVEVSIGVRLIWRAWTAGSTEESTCVVRFLDPLFLVTLPLAWLILWISFLSQASLIYSHVHTWPWRNPMFLL